VIRECASEILNYSADKIPKRNVRRTRMLTDISIENDPKPKDPTVNPNFASSSIFTHT
jgi:hypothetical protein